VERDNVIKTWIWGSAAALLLATAPAWADLKIAYVNFQQLAAESPQAKVLQETIKAEFGPRQRELQSEAQLLKTRQDNLQKNEATMSDEQRTREEKSLRDSEREFQLKQQTAQEDFNARKNEELSRLQRTLIEEVRTYAKAQGYDLVIADSVIYATSSLDITSQVLKDLETLAAKSGGPAPAEGTGTTKTASKPAPGH
jgi:outer membrane protein